MALTAPDGLGANCALPGAIIVLGTILTREDWTATDDQARSSNTRDTSGLLAVDRAYYVKPGALAPGSRLCTGHLSATSIGEAACADGDIPPGECQLELRPTGETLGDLVERFRAYYRGAG